MEDTEKLQRFGSEFRKLSEERKEYVVAVLKALIFAQDTLIKPPPKD